MQTTSAYLSFHIKFINKRILFHRYNSNFCALNQISMLWPRFLRFALPCQNGCGKGISTAVTRDPTYGNHFLSVAASGYKLHSTRERYSALTCRSRFDGLCARPCVPWMRLWISQSLVVRESWRRKYTKHTHTPAHAEQKQKRLIEQWTDALRGNKLANARGSRPFCTRAA